MEITKIKLSDIKPYEGNAKLHPEEQIAQIKESIREFGNNDPIAVDENNIIIEGHGRYIALKELGYDEAECIILRGMTEDQKNAYRLVHNKLTMNSGFDIEILEKELENISIDMGKYDFDLEALGGIQGEAEIFEDETPEVDEENEPITKLGDFYKLGTHYLLCGDSTKKEDVERLMQGKKADLLLTDPPYGINVVSNNGQVGADFGVAKKGNYSKIIADDTTETAQKSYEIINVICDKLIIWGGNYFLDFLPPSDGWIIWDKRVDSGIRNTFADGEMAYCSFHTPIRIYHQLWNGMIREGEREQRVHPTQKPIKMLSEILNDFSKEKEIVLDVFGGSGSTLIACEQLNRVCYMMELDPKYCDVIIKRWETLTGRKAERL